MQSREFARLLPALAAGGNALAILRLHWPRTRDGLPRDCDPGGEVRRILLHRSAARHDPPHVFMEKPVTADARPANACSSSPKTPQQEAQGRSGIECRVTAGRSRSWPSVFTTVRSATSFFNAATACTAPTDTSPPCQNRRYQRPALPGAALPQFHLGERRQLSDFYIHRIDHLGWMKNAWRSRRRQQAAATIDRVRKALRTSTRISTSIRRNTRSCHFRPVCRGSPDSNSIESGILYTTLVCVRGNPAHLSYTADLLIGYILSLSVAAREVSVVQKH